MQQLQFPTNGITMLERLILTHTHVRPRRREMDFLFFQIIAIGICMDWMGFCGVLGENGGPGKGQAEETGNITTLC